MTFAFAQSLSIVVGLLTNPIKSASKLIINKTNDAMIRKAICRICKYVCMDI